MKLEWNTEMTMLMLAARPAVDKVKRLLQENQAEEARETVSHDIVELLLDYRKRELEKYAHTPDNLKSAPNSERMVRNAEKMGAVILLFLAEKDGALVYRPTEEWDLDAAGRLLDEIIES